MGLDRQHIDVYFCMNFDVLFLYDTDYIYIVGEYYDRTRSIWTGGVYRYDSFMKILYGIIVRL